MRGCVSSYITALLLNNYIFFFLFQYIPAHSYLRLRQVTELCRHRSRQRIEYRACMKHIKKALIVKLAISG